jgi:hypothetical protein
MSGRQACEIRISRLGDGNLLLKIVRGGTCPALRAGGSERKGREVERDIRREFIPAWDKRPITDISDLDVLTLIKAKRRTAPAQARNLLGIAKRLFAWAVDQRCYDLKTSPAADLKPTKVIGEKVTGERADGRRAVRVMARSQADPLPARSRVSDPHPYRAAAQRSR